MKFKEFLILLLFGGSLSQVEGLCHDEPLEELIWNFTTTSPTTHTDIWTTTSDHQSEQISPETIRTASDQHASSEPQTSTTTAPPTTTSTAARTTVKTSSTTAPKATTPKTKKAETTLTTTTELPATTSISPTNVTSIPTFSSSNATTLGSTSIGSVEQTARTTATSTPSEKITEDYKSPPTKTVPTTLTATHKDQSASSSTTSLSSRLTTTSTPETGTTGHTASSTEDGHSTTFTSSTTRRAAISTESLSTQESERTSTHGKQTTSNLDSTQTKQQSTSGKITKNQIPRSTVSEVSFATTSTTEKKVSKDKKPTTTSATITSTVPSGLTETSSTDIEQETTSIEEETQRTTDSDSSSSKLHELSTETNKWTSGDAKQPESTTTGDERTSDTTEETTMKDSSIGDTTFVTKDVEAQTTTGIRKQPLTKSTSRKASLKTEETETTSPSTPLAPQTTTTKRTVSSELHSSTHQPELQTTSLVGTTSEVKTTPTANSSSTSRIVSERSTRHTVTAGIDESSSTVTTDPIVALTDERTSVASTAVSTKSLTDTTGTTKVTDMTTSTKWHSDTSTEMHPTTSAALEVTDAETDIPENSSTEREETMSSNTTGEKYSLPLTTIEHSTTTEEKALTTTATHIFTSAKQVETERIISTSTQVFPTVTTTTEPTTKYLEKSDNPPTTTAESTPSSGRTVTPTTTSDETEDKLTTTMQQKTTSLDVSSPKELETLASTKGWTMGESEPPESGTTGKSTDRDVGTTTRQTTNDVHSKPSSSHTTEAQRQTDHSSPGTSNTNVKEMTGLTHQEPTTEKNTVTTQPEEQRTVGTSEGAVTTSGKSGETTTEPSGPPVEHFTDINVGDDESSTTVPDYCSSPCPDNFTEGANYCYMIPPKEKSTTYTMAISFCQMVSGPRSDLATSYDYQDNDNLELFREMLNDLNRTTDAFYLNMLASLEFRKTLKADIVSLKQLSRFVQVIWQRVGSSEKTDGVNSLCRTTKFCEPNTCSFKQFTDLNKEEVVGLPKRKELTAGESIVVRCIQYNTSQVHTIACAETGAFKVHPSMVKCIAPADFEQGDLPSPLDPLHPKECGICYSRGTEFCSTNEDGTEVVCECREGWLGRTCWRAPNLCKPDTCGPRGRCKSLVDRIECECEYGMIGERCTVNATKTSWFGTNETLAIWDVRSLGVAAQASSTFILIGLKFLSKILIVGECEDPQDTYQDYRHALHTIGNLAAVFFTHPDMFGVDAIGCRFFFWMITVCYTLGLVFWVNESINVYTTVRAVHRNTWNKNFAGEDKKYLRFAPRVIVPFLIGVLAVLLVCANSWNTVGTSWSCFGSFSTDATSTWYPLCAGNAALALLAVSFAEATSLLIKNRPHTLVRLHNWFNLNQPANFEIVGKVERNRYFTAIGPILHFLTWATLTVASDKNTSFMDSMSFLLGMTYAGFNFVQMFFTSPAYYAWACIGAMIVLPEKWSPTFEWTNLRNREEVLARYYKRRYKKEQDRKILDEDERKANEQREVDEKNAKLLQKYPNLPSTLLFHCPEEPPVITLPRPFPFDPSGKEYMTAFQREHLARIWTRSYLETRKFHKKSPEKSAFEVVKKEIQRNIFQVKTEDRKKQELFALAQWWNSVPAMDRTKLREHKNTVIMEDENEDDLLAFEREVSRLASIIDLRENRKRKGLLKDPETDPFQKTAGFLKFEPAEAIKCVLFETVDGLGDVRPRKFLKKPPIVLKRQIDEYDKAYSRGVAELNKPFDKTYDDDLMVTQWSDTEHSEAVKEIMNVSPSQIGEQPISMNPRKRPLDEFWFDHERPDFVGPREKHEIPIGPYEEYARKCHYYQSLTDAQWSQIEHNSYHMANLRKIRRGEL